MNAPTKPAELLAAQALADPRWIKMRTRERSADGSFVYSVKTTGVYCRPSCAARPARPENVAFHATPAEAERAGFRACKRCRPDAKVSAHAGAVAAACRTIAMAEQPPTLDELAAKAGLSPHHFHRVFKAQTGVTPRAYGAAHRTRRLREGLRDAGSVTAAIYDAGFNSGGRFYEQADAVLGMTPSAFRGGGADATIRFAVGQCSLGAVLVAATPRGVCAIALGDNPDALLRGLQDDFPNAELVGVDADFEQTVARAVAMVEAPGQSCDLPLDVRGTAFQRRVWEELRKIPAGETATYADVAHRIGAPGAVRAVANACASNRIGVAIPCHRVVRRDGTVSGAGYRWGIDRKRALLLRERQASGRAAPL